MTDELRKRIALAIFDPGQTQGYKGDQDLTTWQTDAVMAALEISTAQTTNLSGLQYRPHEFDDWGMIRNADGSMFASVRRPASEEELAAHRKAGTDPYEDLARRLMASFPCPSSRERDDGR